MTLLQRLLQFPLAPLSLLLKGLDFAPPPFLCGGRGLGGDVRGLLENGEALGLLPEPLVDAAELAELEALMAL